MKRAALFFCAIIFLSSCSLLEKDDNQPEWKKITVPDASTIYSFYGSIDGELLAGASHKIMKTYNRGKTWITVQPDVRATRFIFERDTLFAYHDFHPSFEDYYSLDNGDTWSPYPKGIPFVEREFPVILTTSTGIMYKLVSSDAFPKGPDQIHKSTDEGETWIDIFPYKHYIYSLYLDESDRLYVGASGWEFDEENNTFDANQDNDNAAFLYYLN